MTIPTTAETAVELKARGAFYTPAMVSDFIARWAIRSESDYVLEPACGDGAFMQSAAGRLAELGRSEIAGRLVGVERSPEEAAKAAAMAPGAHVRTSSFFDVEPGDLGNAFDAVIGNPPYIRYHGFTGEDRAKGLARASAVGVQLTRLASSWAHFVAHATAFLGPDGRLGLVLPAELLVTDYAQPVRAHLLARFSSVVVVAFDRPVFDDAQVDAVLLLASNDSTDGLRVVRVADVSGLAGLDVLAGDMSDGKARARWSTSLDTEGETVYEALADSPRTCRLGTLASVDIGVVTGANAYFVLKAGDVARLGLPDAYLVPVVQRPGDVPGLSVRPDEQSRLLRIAPDDVPTDPATVRYLAKGKRDGVPKGYKCRVRRTWYAVPLPKKRPAAFLPYMTADVPRLIVSDGHTWSTNLLHGLTFLPDAPSPRALSAAMLSSVTGLSAEVEGRAYGGGVLKLETRESERLLVPALSTEEAATLERLHPILDELVREGAGARATAIVDAVLGIDSEPLQRARQVFRTRRLDRAKARRGKAK